LYSDAIRQILLAGSRTYPGPRGIQTSLVPGASDSNGGKVEDYLEEVEESYNGEDAVTSV
jgi:hypothetical protein